MVIAAALVATVSALRLEQSNIEVIQSLSLAKAAERSRTEQLYEASRIERQYQATEPENRLVAAELEKRWNSALTHVADMEQRLGEAARNRAPTCASPRDRGSAPPARPPGR